MILVSDLTIFYEMYQVCSELLQCERLPWIYGIYQVCSLVLNIACLDLLWGASLAPIISLTLQMIILMTLIFHHKFTVKPTFRNYINIKEKINFQNKNKKKVEF